MNDEIKCVKCNKKIGEGEVVVHDDGHDFLYYHVACFGRSYGITKFPLISNSVAYCMEGI